MPPTVVEFVGNNQELPGAQVFSSFDALQSFSPSIQPPSPNMYQGRAPFLEVEDEEIENFGVDWDCMD